MINYVKARCVLQPSTSSSFLYEHMDSQSCRALPVVYVPFDPSKRGHWRDRGQILDFAVSAGGGRILDFGPGDGWPSLLLSPFVAEMVGVEGSKHRVETCHDNARRLGVTNVSFVFVPPGDRLPFEDGEFDGVVASSSIEQTPNPRATLAELYRVLKPGGRLRMNYESLSWYEGREEQAYWIVEGWPENDAASESGSAGGSRHACTDPGSTTRLVLYDRHIKEGRVDQYGLVLNLPPADLRVLLANALTGAAVHDLLSHVTQAVTWTTFHPSCRQLLDWLQGVGFRSAFPAHDGGTFAGKLFDRLPESQRPTTLEGVDAYLRPLVEVVAGLEAPADSRPGQWDPWVTAVK